VGPVLLLLLSSSALLLLVAQAANASDVRLHRLLPLLLLARELSLKLLWLGCEPA
jgi:hypothetical protein